MTKSSMSTKLKGDCIRHNQQVSTRVGWRSSPFAISPSNLPPRSSPPKFGLNPLILNVLEILNVCRRSDYFLDGRVRAAYLCTFVQNQVRGFHHSHRGDPMAPVRLIRDDREAVGRNGPPTGHWVTRRRIPARTSREISRTIESRSSPASDNQC